MVKKRILSWVAGVAFSNLDGLSEERHSGSNSLTADGSITLPDRMCAPRSLAFSRTRTRKSWFPASLLSCLRRMAALRPAGPVERLGYRWQLTEVIIPAPTMHTSTSSTWRSWCRMSNGSSTFASRLDPHLENERIDLCSQGLQFWSPGRRRGGWKWEQDSVARGREKLDVLKLLPSTSVIGGDEAILIQTLNLVRW